MSLLWVTLSSLLLLASCRTTRAFHVSSLSTPLTRRGSVQALSMLPNGRRSSSASEPSSSQPFFPFETTETSYPSSSTTTTTALWAKNKEAEDGTSGVRQLLGVKGASAETNIWKIRLQLTKPVTWVPLVWGVMCGAAASGNYHWIWNPFDPNDRDVVLGLTDAAKGFVAMILAGPFLTGYTQTINDW
jgi:chlorophyll/bacteriochlorophyll a synthase